jgi:hypothetical protein
MDLQNTATTTKKTQCAALILEGYHGKIIKSEAVAKLQFCNSNFKKCTFRKALAFRNCKSRAKVIDFCNRLGRCTYADYGVSYQ